MTIAYFNVCFAIRSFIWERVCRALPTQFPPPTHLHVEIKAVYRSSLGDDTLKYFHFTLSGVSCSLPG